MKHYKEVKASEELPKKDGEYRVRLNNDPYGRPMLMNYEKSEENDRWWKDAIIWLKEVDLPTEDEIATIIEKAPKRWGRTTDELAAAKAILTLMTEG